MKPYWFLILFIFILALQPSVNASCQDSWLLRENESNPDSCVVLTAPGFGVFLLEKGQELVSLEQRDILPPVQFSDHFYAEDAVFTNDGLYVKCENGIYYCSEQPVLSVAFDTDRFRIFPTIDDNLFVSVSDKDQSALFLFNCRNKEVSLMAMIPSDVVYAYGSLDEAFVVAGNCIYLLSEHKMEMLLGYFEPIISAVQTDEGLLFGTDDAIMILLEKDTVGVLEVFGCRKLLSTDGVVYIYKNDGSLCRYKTGLAG